MATILRVSPYLDDPLNLPVANLDTAIGFYESVMGFDVVERTESPCKRAILQRDDHQMGLAENGGDPSQEGCFLEVDDVEQCFEEFQRNGLGQKSASFRVDQHGDQKYKVFFVIAPDGLCYCIGQRVTEDEANDGHA